MGIDGVLTPTDGFNDITTFHTSPHARRALRHIGVALGVAWLFCFAHLALGLGGDGIGPVFDLVYYGVLLAAGILAAARAVLHRHERWAWGLIAAGIMAWAGADIYYEAVLSQQPSPPYPSPADAGWLVMYPMTYAGIVLLARSRIGVFDHRLWLDGLLGALAVATVGAAVVLPPILGMTGGSTAGVIVSFAYPLGDMLLMAFVISAIALTGWRPGRMWLLLGIGFALSTIASGWYLHEVAAGTYELGPMDSLWQASSLLLAAAAWQPAPGRRRPARLEGWRVLALPAVFMSAALSMQLLDHYVTIPEAALWLSGAAIGVGIARLCLTVRDNMRMLEASRAEAVTDALTGLRNRRALLVDLDEAIAEATLAEPRVLVLFDLDGFKGYNDSYGHPAGDALLTRLGHRLRIAVAGHGTAYRLGGDEFCVLITPGLEGPEPVIAAAAMALHEHGEGFEITTSFGSVLLPAEAGETSAALQVADRRMYAQKAGGRASAARQSRDVLLTTLREREPELHQHLEGVAALAAAVARELAMSAEERDEVVRAAELHDIGKVAVPDAILNKPAALDDEEWKFMCEHTLVGERILAAAPALRGVAQLVRWSHERWDGSGYPDRIAGEEIPLGARVVAVCDAYEAMTSDRPYTERMSEAAAVADLRRCSGTQFDPAVVDAFIRVHERTHTAA